MTETITYLNQLIHLRPNYVEIEYNMTSFKHNTPSSMSDKAKTVEDAKKLIRDALTLESFFSCLFLQDKRRNALINSATC